MSLSVWSLSLVQQEDEWSSHSCHYLQHSWYRRSKRTDGSLNLVIISHIAGTDEARGKMVLSIQSLSLAQLVQTKQRDIWSSLSSHYLLHSWYRRSKGTHGPLYLVIISCISGIDEARGKMVFSIQSLSLSWIVQKQQEEGWSSRSSHYLQCGLCRCSKRNDGPTRSSHYLYHGSCRSSMRKDGPLGLVIISSVVCVEVARGRMVLSVQSLSLPWVVQKQQEEGWSSQSTHYLQHCLCRGWMVLSGCFFFC